MPKTVTRPDRDGTHRLAFERNKKKIYATQTVCGICGKPVDFSCKFPHPLSPCIDHIIPSRQGRPPQRPCQPAAGAFLVQPAEERQAVYAGRRAEPSRTQTPPLALPLSTDWTSRPRPLRQASRYHGPSHTTDRGGCPPPRGPSDLPVPYCEYFLAKGESTAL